MPPVKVVVEVKSESDVERGRFTISVEFPGSITALSDVFASQGVFDSLEKRFQDSIRTVISEYSKMGPGMIDRIKNVSGREGARADLVKS